MYSSELFSESENATTVPEVRHEGARDAPSKSQKRKLRKKNKTQQVSGTKVLAPSGIKEDAASIRTSSSSDCQPLPRRYIVDSGASFHLVDPRTLSKKEQSTIEDIETPIPIETANGEVTVTQRCRVRVIELNIEVWAFLHVDTVCVLALGLLVNCNGFSHFWTPGKNTKLKKGKFVVACIPHYNVPFIYSAAARGLPLAHSVAEGRQRQWTIEEILAEDVVHPPPVPFVHASKDGDSDESAARRGSQSSTVGRAPRRRQWG